MISIVHAVTNERNFVMKDVMYKLLEQFIILNTYGTQDITELLMDC